MQLAAVDAIIAAVDNEHVRHLLLLQGSPKYLERQALTLRQQLEHADKMVRLAEELRSREQELLLTIQGSYPKCARSRPRQTPRTRRRRTSQLAAEPSRRADEPRSMVLAAGTRRWWAP